MLRRQLCAFLLLTAILQVEGATVTWVGPSGDWSAAANWSTGSLPGASDDVVIPAGTSITVTHSTGTDSVNSIVCNQTFTLSGGSLSVTTTLQANGPMNLSGGTLIDATVQANGGSFVVGGSGSVLEEVTVQGTLDVGNSINGATLTVENGLTLDGTMLVGNPANSSEGEVSFAGDQVLDGNGTVVFGNYPYNGLVEANGGATLVLGAGITVRGQNGWIGYDPGIGAGSPNGIVANQGTITADLSRGTITIAGASFNNQGTLEAQNGGTLNVQDMAGDVNQVSLGDGSVLVLDGTYVNNFPLNVPAGAELSLDGTWANSGSIDQEPGALLILGGNWNTAGGGGTIQASAGQLNLQGSYTLAMVQSLQLSSNESVYLVGTLTNTGGTLVVNAAVAPWYLYGGGTIVGGTVTTTNGSSLVVYNTGTLNGVTVNGLLDVGNNINGATLTVENGLTLDGTMLVGNPTNSSEGEVSFAGGQMLDGNGTVVFGNYPYNGLVEANGGATLVLGAGITVRGQNGWIGYDPGIGAGSPNGIVANQGTIAADLSRGTITIAGASFNNQGTLEIQNGGTLTVQDMAGTVGHVTLGAGSTLNLNGSYTNNLGLNMSPGSVLQLAGTWANSGSIVQGPGGVLELAGNWNAAGGGGTIQASAGQLNLYDSYTLAMVQSLQLSSNESVYLVGTLTNTGGTLVVNAAVAPWYLYGGGTIVGGTVTTTNGSSLVVYNTGTLNGVTVNGLLDVGNSVYGATLTVENGLTLDGTMLVGNPTNSSEGEVSFAGGQMLDGNGTVVFGNYPYNGLVEANGGATLVLGAGITVRGQNGWIGYDPGIGAGSPNGIVANQGTIAADLSRGTITIAGASFNNQGTLEIQNGGTLTVQDMAGTVGHVTLGAESTLNLNGSYTNNLGLNMSPGSVLQLAGTWANSGSIVQGPGGVLELAGNWNAAGGGGTIQASAGQLNLYDSYTLAMVQSLQLSSNESVYLVGTLTNTGGTLVVNAAVAPWYLYGGGTIVGGTVTTTNGSSLVVYNTGTLNGVTVNGLLDVGNSVYGATLTVENGLTLDGTMLVGNPTNSSEGEVSFAGGQMLDGNGTVVFGNYPYNGLVEANGGATLVLGAGITVRGQNGWIGYDPGIGAGSPNGIVANQGTIAADLSRGTITIAGASFNNQGTLEIQNGGTLTVQDMAGTVGHVTLGAESTLNLNGSYTNNLGLNMSPGSVLQLAGTWANSGSIVQGPGGVLELAGNWNAAGGGGTIQASAGQLNLYDSYTLAMVQSLQLSSNESVYLVGTLTNTGGTLVVNAAVAPWYLYGGGTIVGGTVTTTNGSSLVVYNTGTLNGVTVNGLLDVGNSVYGATLTVENGLTLDGTMLVGNPTNSSEGEVSFAGGQMLDGNGTVVFGNYPYNGLVEANGGATLVLGAGITVRGQNGWIGYDPGIGAGSPNGIVANQGTIAADLSRGTITIAGASFNNQGTLEIQNGGAVVPDSNSTMNSGAIIVDSGTMSFANAFSQTVGILDFGLGSPSAFGQITFSGIATLGGTLAAHLDGTNTPNIGDSFAVLSYGSNPLSFTNVDLPSSNDWQTNATNGTLTLVAGIVRLNSVTVSPSNSVVPVGSTVTLVATVTGPGPLTFQWLQNGANMAGATNSTLVLSNVTHSNTGAYTVVVTDPGGSLSGVPVQVLVLAPPVLVSPPPSQTDLVGSVVNLNVMVSADQPLSYQWLFNGANVAGATNSDLTFGDITRAQAGTYEVVVSNPVGVVTSTPPAVLTVVTPPVCPSAPSGMVAWWRGNGDTSDYAGTNDAVFEGTAAYAPGEVGQAFSFDGASSYLQVPNSPAWDFATNDFSIEFWASFAQVLPSLIAGDESIVFLAHDEESDTPNKWIFGLGGGKLYLYINSSAAGPQFLVQAPFGPQTNQWYHLSVTKASGALTIYVNGKQISAATNNLAIPTADAPLTIGQAEDFFMKGLMDEISIYDRALTAVEIAGIYEAGAAGKCPSTQPLAISAEGFNSAGQFKFQILGGQSGAALQVQASSDLANWSNIWQTIRSSGSETFIDTNSTLNLTRFYRANISQ